MHISIIHERLGRSRGGIEAWVYHASEALLRVGHKVTVFHTQPEIPCDAVPDGVHVISLQQPRHLPAVSHLIQVVSYARQLKTHVDDYDAIWCRCPFLCCALCMLGVKRVLFIHAAPYPYYGKLEFNRWKAGDAGGFRNPLRILSGEVTFWLAGRIEKYVLQSSCNVYLSRSRMHETLDFYRMSYDPERFHVVPPGVDLSRFSPAGEKWQGEGILKVITVCRLEPDKNVQCIIRAIASLGRAVPVSLTIIGSGTYEAQLKSLVTSLQCQDRVVFAGRRENVENWYSDHHLFVLPTLYEGFGSVFIEAMASGLPCIAIRHKEGKYLVASDEIIAHEKTGWLMQENAPDELAALLAVAYNHPADVRRFAQAARERVEGFYTWSRAIEQLFAISRSQSI